MQFLIIIFIILIFMSSIINEASKKSRINDENEFKRLMKNIKKSRDEINIDSSSLSNKSNGNRPEAKQASTDENEYFSLEDEGIKEAEERVKLTTEEIDKNYNEEDYSQESDAEDKIIRDNPPDKNEAEGNMIELNILDFNRIDLVKTVIFNELISKPKCKRDV